MNYTTDLVPSWGMCVGGGGLCTCHRPRIAASTLGGGEYKVPGKETSSPLPHHSAEVNFLEKGATMSHLQPTQQQGMGTEWEPVTPTVGPTSQSGIPPGLDVSNS